MEPSDDFAEFARRQLPALLRAATAICGDPHLAEDLCQNVLIKTMRSWRKVRSLDRPESYVRRMLVNEFLSQRRRTRPTPVADPPDLPSPADPIGQVDDRNELALAIAALPPPQQVALALRYWADLPDEEIAAALGCRPATVRSHLHRALATLRVDQSPTTAPTAGGSR